MDPQGFLEAGAVLPPRTLRKAPNFVGTIWVACMRYCFDRLLNYPGKLSLLLSLSRARARALSLSLSIARVKAPTCIGKLFDAKLFGLWVNCLRYSAPERRRNNLKGGKGFYLKAMQLEIL